MFDFWKTPWVLVFAAKPKLLIRFLLLWNICILSGIIGMEFGVAYVQPISFLFSGALLFFVCMSLIWNGKARARWLKRAGPPIYGFTWIFFFILVANMSFFSGVFCLAELTNPRLKGDGGDYGAFIGLLITLTEFFLLQKKVKRLSSNGEKND